MTKQPRRWWPGRTTALIAIAITVPFLVLATFLVRSIASDLAHHREMERSLTTFEQAFKALPALHRMQDLSAARVHVNSVEMIEQFSAAKEQADFHIMALVADLQPYEEQRLHSQANLLMRTWQELHVSPGWNVEKTEGPFENIELAIRELYQSLSAVLYSNPTHNATDLQIHDLLRPLLGPIRQLRRDISMIGNISVYTALRDGYITSIDAEALDTAWLSIEDTLGSLRHRITQFNEDTLSADARERILTALKNVEEFHFTIDEEVILAAKIEFEWQQAVALSSECQQAMQNITGALLSEAHRLHNHSKNNTIIFSGLFSVLLIFGYVSLLGLSLMVYRSNYVAVQARQESVAKSNFLARMGHEIRTPMNGVLGLAELLRDTDPSPRQQEYIELIESAGRSLVTLINDILDYAKIEAGKMELETVDFDLRSMIYESVHMFSLRADENATLILADVDPALPGAFRGDATRLRQVLINLISNAVKFTHQGRIEVAVKPAQEQGNDDAIRLRIEVRDTGIGIPEESRERIFSVFSQASADVSRRFGGTGLGLAICREIMTLMGGDIGVEGNSPNGTVFWFEVALAQSEHANSTQEKDLTVGTPAVLLDPEEQLAPFLSSHTQFDNVRLAREHSELHRLIVSQDNNRPAMVVINGLDPLVNISKTARELKQLDSRLHIRVVSGVRQTTNANDPQDADIDSFVHRSVFTLAHLVRLFDPRADSLHNLQHSNPITHTDRLPAGISVLVAEDNPVNQMVTRGFLGRLGASQILVASNGREAVDMYVKQRGVDIVLMDLDMPEMDGFEAARIIRQREQQNQWPRANILALSAHALPQYQHMVTDAGMDGQLVKPVTLQGLYTELARLFPSSADRASA